MGRSEESKEQRKKAARERYRKLAEDPAWRQKEALRRARYRNSEKAKSKESARSKERYERNKELRIEQRKRWARENRERQLKNQREYYARNREEQLRKILGNRKRRDPTIGLKTAIDDFRGGNITINELDRRINEALKAIDGRTILGSTC